MSRFVSRVAVVVLLVSALSGCMGAARRMLSMPAFTSDGGHVVMVRVPMRDGVTLTTHVYLPEGDGPWPVILVRNPYNFPTGFRLLAKMFARYGYVGVHQLVRGRDDSEGAWEPFFNEREDGIDTLQWILEQPWQDGNIGLFGASYLSMVQWAVADALPAEVKTLVPMVWGSDLRGLAFEGGVFRPEVVTTWAALMNDERFGWSNMFRFRRALKHRPPITADEEVLGRRLPWYRDWLEAVDADAPLWNLPDARMLQEMPERVKVPVLMLTGWYDIFLPSQLGDFERLATKEQSRLIIGPWTHLMGVKGDGVLPRPGARGGAELLRPVLDWFDHHLKGRPLGDWGPVETYSLGDGTWRRWASWPPEVSTRTWHFHEADRSSVCEGGVLLTVPGWALQSARYVYDPDDPVPSRGGSGLLAFAVPGWRGTPPSNRSQKGLCQRDDVLSFVSPPLEEDLHLLGRAKVHLTVSTDVDDTAFTVKLVEVDPKGRAVNIQDTITSLAYRNGAHRPQPYTPEEIVELELSLWPIEWVVRKGHRLRVDVSSSNFPAYHPHSNFAGPWAHQSEVRKATQTLYFGPSASRVELPVWEGSSDSGRR